MPYPAKRARRNGAVNWLAGAVRQLLKGKEDEIKFKDYCMHEYNKRQLETDETQECKAEDLPDKLETNAEMLFTFKIRELETTTLQLMGTILHHDAELLKITEWRNKMMMGQIQTKEIPKESIEKAEFDKSEHCLLKIDQTEAKISEENHAKGLQKEMENLKSMIAETERRLSELSEDFEEHSRDPKMHLKPNHTDKDDGDEDKDGFELSDSILTEINKRCRNLMLCLRPYATKEFVAEELQELKQSTRDEIEVVVVKVLTHFFGQGKGKG